MRTAMPAAGCRTSRSNKTSNSAMPMKSVRVDAGAKRSMPRFDRDPRLTAGRSVEECFRGDRFRILFLELDSFSPNHVLDVPSRIDAAAEGHYRPGDLTCRDKALEEASRYNRTQVDDSGQAASWAIVVEVGQPMRSRRFSGCQLIDDLGWEEDHLVYPLRVLRPTPIDADQAS